MISTTEAMRVAATAALVVGLAVGTTGCAEQTQSAAVARGAGDIADRGYAVTMLTNRPPSSRIVTYTTFAEALPNHAYRKGDRAVTVSDAVVAGRIVAVHKGQGFYVPGEEDAPSGTLIPFDDKRAQWKTIHLEVAVGEQLAGDPLGPTVMAGMVVADMRTEFEQLADGLLSFDRVVVPLQSQSANFSYDKAVFAVADGGSLLAAVDAKGQLTLPLARDGSGERLIAPTRTVELVKRELARPAVVLSPRGIA